MIYFYIAQHVIYLILMAFIMLYSVSEGDYSNKRKFLIVLALLDLISIFYFQRSYINFGAVLDGVTLSFGLVALSGVYLIFLLF